jgi:polar amino acid transport system substrate-binding protein
LPFAIAFPRLAGLFLALALAVTALLPARALAQQEPEFFDVPFAPGQWNLGRRLDESQLRYCVDRRDPAWEVDGAIADAIAGALLLEPKPYVVESEIVIEDITRVYALMLEHCDIHMGFKLIPDGYADWITLSRAYYETQYLFVTADPNLRALADLAPSLPIGATQGSSAHIRLISYLSAQPAAKRWSVYPYGTNDLALASLLKGDVSVALVWAPSLWVTQQADPAYAKVHMIDPKPLPPTTIGVGALMLSNETFLRTAVDQAITALTADGTIQSILDKYKFPATAKP